MKFRLALALTMFAFMALFFTPAIQAQSSECENLAEIVEGLRESIEEDSDLAEDFYESYEPVRDRLDRAMEMMRYLDGLEDWEIDPREYDLWEEELENAEAEHDRLFAEYEEMLADIERMRHLLSYWSRLYSENCG